MKDLKNNSENLKLDEYIHIIIFDKNNITYCRAVNQIINKEKMYRCEYCPLWNGSKIESGCIYRDTVSEEKLMPIEQKQETEGLIAMDIVGEFPEFAKQWVIGKERFSIEERKLYEKAILYAADAHKGQYRKGTKLPYIIHPVEVSMILFYEGADLNTIIAGALHDVVEDTDRTIKDIEKNFGTEVSELVEHESENKRSHMDSKKSWHIRKQEHIQALNDSPMAAKQIALADKLSNIRATARDYEENGNKIWDKFNQPDVHKQAWYYLSMLDALKELSDTKMWNELSILCQKVFSDDYGKNLKRFNI